MAALLGKFSKQPGEVLDYDVDFTEWFSTRTDTATSFTVTVSSAAITVVSSARTGNVVRVILSGGASGGSYKVTVRLTTSSGIVKEADFQVAVKEV